MKKPIFSETERRLMALPQAELLKLRIKRDFERSEFYAFLDRVVNWMGRIFEKYGG